ncbi:USP domain-containing protein, variant 2 [Balamuthia mandrillaris]
MFQYVLHAIALYITSTNTKRRLVKLLNWLFDPDLAFYQIYSTHRIGENYYDNSLTDVSGFFTTPNGQASPYLLQNINAFGEVCGFEYIVDRLQDEQNPISLARLVKVLGPFARIRKCLLPMYAKPWVKRVSATMFKRILELPDNELKIIPKEDLNKTLEVLDKLCKLCTQQQLQPQRLLSPLDDIELDDDDYYNPQQLQHGQHHNEAEEDDPMAFAEVVERFKLNFAYKCLHSSSLERRLNGLNAINKLIMMATRKDAEDKTSSYSSGYAAAGYGYAARRMQRLSSSAKWLTKQRMANWLEGKGIVEELFGKKMHIELISRSRDVLSLLVESNKFGEDYLDLLWNAAAGTGKEERMTETVFELIDMLVLHLEPEHLDHLLLRIKETQIYDSHTLALLNSITLQQLSDDPDEERKTRGLLLFWDAIQDEHFISEAVSKEATTYLKNIIPRSRCQLYRMSFMNLCLANLQNHSSVPQSLKLLLSILETFSDDPRINERAAVIIDMAEEQHLMDRFFSDLQMYKEKAIENAAQQFEERERAQDSTHNSYLEEDDLKHDINNLILVGVQPHLKQVEIRLKFLRFLLSHSPLYISSAQLDQLWDNLVERALTEKERDTAFLWFQSVCGHGSIFSYDALSQAMSNFFLGKCCGAYMRQNFATITQAGFDCFEQYFRYHNMEQRKLSPLSSSKDFVVSDLFGLYGLDCLWQLALNVRDERVAQRAIDSLYSLYDIDKLSPELQQQIDTIRGNFLDTIMLHLEEASNKDGTQTSTENALRIQRCLELLRNFVQEYENRQELLASALELVSSSNADQQNITLQFYWFHQGVSFDMKFTPKETMGDVRKKVAHKIQKDIDFFTLRTVPWDYFDGDNDNLTLGTVGMADGTTVHLNLLDGSDSLELLEEHEDTATIAALLGLPEVKSSFIPSYALSNNQTFFYLLFSLLSLDSKIAETAWDLICMLPTNAAMERSIRTFHITPQTLTSATSSSSSFPSVIATNDDDDLLPTSPPPPSPSVSSSSSSSEESSSLLESLPAPIPDEEEKPDWTRLVDTRSTFSLLYSLRIIKGVLGLDNSTTSLSPSASSTNNASPSSAPYVSSTIEEEEEARSNWAAAFIENGGLAHIIDALVHHERFQGSLAKSCLLAVTEIIDFILKNDVLSSRREALRKVVDYSSLVKGLATVVWRSARDVTSLSSSSASSSSSTVATINMDVALVKNAMKILTGVVSHQIGGFAVVNSDKLKKPNLLKTLFRLEGFEEFIYFVVLKCSEAAIREEMIEALDSFYTIGGKRQRRWLLVLMFTFLPKIEPTSQTCNEYFSLMSELLRHHKEEPITECEAKEEEEEEAEAFNNNEQTAKKKQTTLNDHQAEEKHKEKEEEEKRLRETLFTLSDSELLQSFAQALLLLIKYHPILEASEHDPPDLVLIGLLHLTADLSCLLSPSLRQSIGSSSSTHEGVTSVGSVGLIEEIIVECLFKIPSPHITGSSDEPTLTSTSTLPPPKCKTKNSRIAAFHLLEELCKDCPKNQLSLVHFIAETHLKTYQQLQKQSSSPVSSSASSSISHDMDLSCNASGELASYKNENKNAEEKAEGKRSFLHISEWGFSPTAGERSSTGYVGLKNLGCICYMNSLMQQLFMMPNFRSGILSVSGTEEMMKKREERQLINASKEKNKKNKKDKENDIDEFSEKEEEPSEEELLLELQEMFAYLQESIKQYYSPKRFCMVYKDYDGRPIDVSVQMDADEFFNMLCDKLDNHLKGSHQEKLLHNIWCGKMTSQLICKGCPHRSERDEPFYTISLDIKGKKDILEALQLYVRGDMLEGDNAYFCELCGKHVDTLKRSCIKTLPNTLILHLKRFEFDFDTMVKMKLNQHCEFPFKLNMLPYTREGLAAAEEEEEQKRRTRQQQQQKKIGKREDGDDEDDDSCVSVASNNSSEAESNNSSNNNDDKDGESSSSLPPLTHELPPLRPHEYYEYELVGILVHRGVADSGHYYSFIKERTGDSTARWLEFNDRTVRPFDINRLEEECFGGYEVIPQYDEFTKVRVQRQVENSRSAYMLFYERIVPQAVSSDEEEMVDKAVSKQEESIQVHVPAAGSPRSTPSNAVLVQPDLSISKGLLAGVSLASRLFSESGGSSSTASSRCESSGQKRSLVPVPPFLYNAIWHQNVQFLQQKRMFEDCYFQFVSNLIQPCTQLHFDYHERMDISTQKAVEMGFFFFLEIISHSREKDRINHFSEQLRKILKANVAACRWWVGLLVDKPEWLREMLLDCSSEDARQNFAELIHYALKYLLKAGERDYLQVFLAEGEEREEAGGETMLKEGQIVRLCIDRVLELDRYAVLKWRNFGQYFTLFFHFALLGPTEMAYLLRRNVISRFLDIYLGPDSPNARRRLYMRFGDKWQQPDFSSLISLVCLLLRSCHIERDQHEEVRQICDADDDTTEEVVHSSPVSSLRDSGEAVFPSDDDDDDEIDIKGGELIPPTSPQTASFVYNAKPQQEQLEKEKEKEKENETETKEDEQLPQQQHNEPEEETERRIIILSRPSPTQAEGPLFTLSEQDSEMVFNEAFLLRLVSDPQAISDASLLLSHLCWENLSLSDLSLHVLIMAIQKANYEGLSALHKILLTVLNLEDFYAELRVRTILPRLLDLFEDKKKFPKSTEINLRFLIHKLYERNAVAQRYMDDLAAGRRTAVAEEDEEDHHQQQPRSLEWITAWLSKHTHNINVPGWIRHAPDYDPSMEISLSGYGKHYSWYS